MAGPSASLRAAYAKRLDVLRARAAQRSQAAFDAFALRRDWDELIGDLYVAWTSGQVDALAATDMMSAATIFANGGDVPTASLIRPTYAGSTAGRTALMDVLSATQRVVGNRMLNGYTYLEAFGQSARWLDGALAGDVDRVARDAMLDAAVGPDPRMVGWQRVAEPGACSFCRALTTRGAVYKSEASALATTKGKRYHRRCRCSVVGVADEFTQRRSIKEGQAVWARMLATGDVPRIRGRSSAGTVAVAKGVNLTRSWTLQRDQLRASIPDLQARVAAGDTAAERPLAWQSQRVAELERLLTAAQKAA